MRWLLIFFTGLALVLSACGKIGSGERIAVVNWEKALQEHPQYVRLQNLKDEYNRLLDKRREQEIIGKTRMSNLAKLYQLKQNSKQNYMSAEFLTRMTEKQTEEQKKLDYDRPWNAEKLIARSYGNNLNIIEITKKLNTISMDAEFECYLSLKKTIFFLDWGMSI